MRRSVKSWDVFDTLVARRCVEPQAVFAAMEREINVPHFAKFRQLAERTAVEPTFAGIYRRLQQITGMNDELRDALMKIELDTERKELFLIPETYDQVQDGDILISDMYLDSETIRGLLRSCGFNRNVTVYASPGGKNTGAMWPRVKADGIDITLHTGDNIHSDVVSPYQYGVPSRHFTGTRPTALEQQMARHGLPHVARIMRTSRLQNPYLPGSLDYTMWNEQTQVNGPLLYLASMQVHQLLHKRDDVDHVMFPTRDACHWHRLYKGLYPEDRADYFHSSRSIYYKPTAAYLDYMRSFGDPAKALIADVFGSGRSTEAFFTKHMGALPMLYLLSSPEEGPTDELRAKMRIITLFDQSPAAAMERLNYDMVGTLVDFTAEGPVRTEPRPEMRYLATYHRAINGFIAEALRARRDTQATGDNVTKMLMALLVHAHTGAMISRLIPHDPDWLLRQSSATSVNAPMELVPMTAPPVANESASIMSPEVADSTADTREPPQPVA